jgi:hypothetical protein
MWSKRRQTGKLRVDPEVVDWIFSVERRDASTAAMGADEVTGKGVEVEFIEFDVNMSGLHRTGGFFFLAILALTSSFQLDFFKEDRAWRDMGV